MTAINLYFDSAVAGATTDTQLSAIVPTGQVVFLKSFGGSDVKNAGNDPDSIIAIQWGSGVSWTTIRAGSGQFFETTVGAEFVGDGVKRFRLVRQNRASAAHPIGAWVTAVVRSK